LGSEEVQALKSANNLLGELTTGSPYMKFQNCYNDFFKELDEQSYKSANGKLVQHELENIFGKLDSLMSSLKGFEDRTRSLISSRYGKDSDQMNIFKEALSYEFDNAFAYRFCYHLRNYSQHNGSQVGTITSKAELKGNQPISITEIILNSNYLLNSYDNWHSKIKQDLRSINSDFSLIPILRNLRFSCFRAYAKYLLSQESDITDAIQSIQLIVGNYEPLKDVPHILEAISEVDEDDIEMSIVPIATNLIETIKPLIDNANRVILVK